MEQCTSAICLPIQSRARPRAHITDSVKNVMQGMQRPTRAYEHFEGVVFLTSKLVSDSLMKRAEQLPRRDFLFEAKKVLFNQNQSLRGTPSGRYTIPAWQLIIIVY